MKSKFLVAASLFALLVGSPAYASSFILTPRDGDETKLFFDKPSLTPQAGGDRAQASDIKNNGTDNVNIFTQGTVKNLGSGYGSIDGTNKNGDFLTAVTFVPGLTSFDGFFFRGQIGTQPGVTSDPAGGGLTVTVTGVDNVITTFFLTNLGINKDIGDLGVEAQNDTDLIKSITLSTAPGEFFEEFKQVDLSGVAGAAVPEPATWIELIFGFGLVGWMIRFLPRYAARQVKL